jgi:hypothetical protein
MTRYEYRLERLAGRGGGMLLARLLDRLNEQSLKGWRVAFLDFGVWPPPLAGEITVLLERERPFPAIPRRNDRQ